MKKFIASLKNVVKAVEEANSSSSFYLVKRPVFF